jgi:CheY-like chemotaxis protein
VETSVEDLQAPYLQMPAGTYVCISVRDTGTGMSEEVQAHIFEPFYTTKGNAGTGLGLSSVYGIIKQSGGYIWCGSELGKGTTFKIYLRPAKGAPDSQQRPESDPEPAQHGAETVLIVDDDEGVRTLIMRILRTRGYTVLEAEHGEAALAMLNDRPTAVDLIISDIVMPEMGGVELAERVHTRWPDIKILFVSGYPQGATIDARSVASLVPVLGKPFTPARIASAVRELLDPAAPERPRDLATS